jgi:hypothetical protein
VESGTDPAGVLKQLGDGVDRHVRDAGGGAERHPLAQQGEDLDALGRGQPVHARHDMNTYA